MTVKNDFEQIVSRMSKLEIFDLDAMAERMALAFLMHETYNADKDYYCGLVERTTTAIDGWLSLGEADDQMLTYFGCGILVVWLDKLDQFPSIVENTHGDAEQLRFLLDTLAGKLTDIAINNRTLGKILFGFVPEKYVPAWFYEI